MKKYEKNTKKYETLDENLINKNMKHIDQPSYFFRLLMKSQDILMCTYILLT